MNSLELLEERLHIKGLASQGLWERYGGAWWCARRLLKNIYAKNPRVIRDATFDLRELPFTQAARNVLWRREITPDMIGLWVHHYDKNSQYLAACRSVYTGIGSPIHLDSDEVEKGGLPGIYRVTWDTRRSIFDGIHWPFIIEPGQEWITNDVLQFARRHDYRIQIREAWVFEDQKRLLVEWATQLWNARVALKGIDQKAASLVNAVAHVGPGAFATGKEIHKGIDLIHPNWWSDIVGFARQALLANLLRYGCPVCIRTDGLYYVSSNPDIRLAVTSVNDGTSILDRERALGGYKIPDGWQSFQITQAIVDAARGLDDGELSSLFKQHGGIK